MRIKREDAVVKSWLVWLSRGLTIFAAIRFLGPLIVTSARTEPTNSPTVLPPMLVTATNRPESLTSPSFGEAVRKRKEVPGGYTVQGFGPMTQGRVSSIDDFFQDAPGVVMLSENEVEVSKVFIRGSGVYSEDEPAGVQYLIDGLTLNQADGEIILEDFDVSTIKYSEIYRGADALKYGALGLGGAVNFVPFTGYDAAPAGVRLEGGSFGFFRGQASSGGVEGPFDYYASVSGRDSAGYREHSGESTEVLFSDFGYKINDHLEDRCYVIADQTDRQLPGALSLQQLNQNPQQAQDDGTSTGAVAENFRKDWYYLRLADKLSYISGGEEADAGGYWWHREAYEPNLYVNDPADPANDYNQGIGSFYADDFGALLNSTTRSHFLGQDNIFTIGVNPTTEREVDAYFQNLSGKQGDLTGADKEWSFNAILYAQNQHYLTEKLSLVTGAQLGYAQRHFYDDYNNTASGNQSADLIFRSVNPKIGLLYELNDKGQLFANFSRSWQPPSFDDMVDFDSGANTSQVLTPLGSQKAWTAEIGTRGEQGRFEWDFALYHSWVRDELFDQYNPQTDQDIGAVNIPHTYNQGAELGLNVRLFDSVFQQNNPSHFADTLTLRQDFTLSDLHFSHDSTYGNNRIAGVPEYDYQVQLLYENPNGFYAGPNLHWIATSYPVDNSNTLNAPAYALIGFKAGMQVCKSVSVFFEAKNLADERYASSVDPISDNGANGGGAGQTAEVFHPGDPRAFYFGVTWKL